MAASLTPASAGATASSSHRHGEHLALAPLTLDLLASKYLRAVHRIDEQVYPDPWSLNLLRQELKLTNRVHQVVLVQGRVVGHCGLLIAPGEAHVTTIAVDPAASGFGIGSALMLAMVDAAIAFGTPALTLEVRVSNLRARALYQRFGFVPAGVRKQYYADTKEDALVMWANDLDSAEYEQRLAALRSTARQTQTTPILERFIGSKI